MWDSGSITILKPQFCITLCDWSHLFACGPQYLIADVHDGYQYHSICYCVGDAVS